jgi:hypothetical protein
VLTGYAKAARHIPITYPLARGFRSFGSLARVRVLRKREVTHNEPHSIAKLVYDPIEYRMLARATRTFEVGKLNDRN